jgi:peptidoglycan-associated lipoprotein
LRGYCLCIDLDGTEQDLIANVGDRVFFDVNKANIYDNDGDVTTLNRQAAWLKKYPKIDVIIAGNTDERGTETYNLALGYRRATVVRNFLIAKGVANSRLQIISYGKSRPVEPGNDAASYEANRNAITSVIGFSPQDSH